MSDLGKTELSAMLRLSAQRAMLGQVTPNIRKVFIRFRGSVIELVTVFDGEVPEDDRERMEEVTSEILSDFPDIDLILATCMSVPWPAPINQHIQDGDDVFACIYARHEGA